jgi:hypothetical protein
MLAHALSCLPCSTTKGMPCELSMSFCNGRQSKRILLKAHHPRPLHAYRPTCPLLPPARLPPPAWLPQHTLAPHPPCQRVSRTTALQQRRRRQRAPTHVRHGLPDFEIATTTRLCCQYVRSRSPLVERCLGPMQCITPNTRPAPSPPYMQHGNGSPEGTPATASSIRACSPLGSATRVSASVVTITVRSATLTCSQPATMLTFL